MTSSVHDLPSGSARNNGGADEQQKHPEPNIQNQSPAAGIFHPALTTPSVEYMMPHSPDVGASMAHTVYPYPDPYYGSLVAPYGAQAMIQPHMMGMQQAGLPLPTDAVVDPVFVNAKQYHGIMRRRKSRAKAELENKLIKSRKPYLHESRHLHALKRARGCGGRFLNAKTDEDHQTESSMHNKIATHTKPPPANGHDSRDLRLGPENASTGKVSRLYADN